MSAAEPGGDTMRVEVAYARPDEQVIVSVDVPAGATVRDVLAESRICERFPEIDLDRQKVGIFSRLVKLDEPVRAKDRVEIYRPLIADPKEMRRRRAKGRTASGGG